MEKVFLYMAEAPIFLLNLLFILALIFTALAQTLFKRNMAGLALVIYYMLALFTMAFAFLFFLTEHYILMATGIAMTLVYISNIFTIIIEKGSEEV